MRLDRLTNKTRAALVAAEQLATKNGHPELYPEHFLVELIGQSDGVAGAILQKAGLEPRAIAERLAARLGSMPQVSGGAEPTISRRLRTLLTLSLIHI